MRRRWFFVGAPVAYAVTVSLALAAGQSRGEGVEILFLMIALSVAAGVVAWRFADRLEAARAQAERGREELAPVGQLSATRSGPLTPPELATQFLARIAVLVPPSVVTTLLQYEEDRGVDRAPRAAGRLARVAARGRLPGRLAAAGECGRGSRGTAELHDRRHGADPRLGSPRGTDPGARGCAAVRALPLVSRSRLIGTLSAPQNVASVVLRDLAGQITVAAPVTR